MTAQTKVAVVYYSSTGTVYELAKLIVEGAEKAGAEVRLLKVPELAPEEAIATNAGWVQHIAATQHIPEATLADLDWADGLIFGSGTRYGLPSAQLKQFLDTTGPLWFQGKLTNKVYSGFTSATTQHGGLETTILALNNVFTHFGGIIVPPGYTDGVKFVDGNPYGTSFVTGREAIPIDEATRNAAIYQGKRVADIATALKAGGLVASS